MLSLFDKLTSYRDGRKIISKGRLALVVYITHKAKTEGLPLEIESLIAKSTGQVAGLSKSAVQSVLADYGITKVLAGEGGRTSRGNLELMRDYVLFLNNLHENEMDDIQAIEKWWIERVNDFFSSKPFKLKFETGHSLRELVSDLLDQAKQRQNENPGTMYMGAMLQHLIGAKLSLVLGDDSIEHHGFSVADESSNREGDFMIKNTVLHVTTSPGDAIMEKCIGNLNNGRKPIIITIHGRIQAAISLAEDRGIVERIKIIDAEQFISTNVHEWCKFDEFNQPEVIGKYIDAYNKIVDEHETDPSMRIDY